MQGRRWVLKRHGETVEIVSPRQHGHGARLFPQLFQWAFADPMARATILDIFQYLGGRLPGRMSDKQLRELVEKRIEAALLSGALGIWSDQLASFGGGSFAPPPSGIVPEPPQKSGPAADEEEEEQDESGGPAVKKTTRKQKKDNEPEKTWIEIKLVDQDYNPVGKRKYKLTLTDGTTKEGVLDADGSVRVTGIDPGNCQFTLLDLDGQEWNPE